MDAPWNRRGTNRGGPTERPRHRRRPEFTALEDRRLMAVGTVTATVYPRVLVPNEGQVMDIWVYGQVQQVVNDNLPGKVTSLTPAQLAADTASNETKPAPNELIGLVTDQYRQVEPRVFSNVDPTVVSDRTIFRPWTAGVPQAAVVTIRTYSYSFLLKLPDKAPHINRQFAITVFANDFEGGNQLTVFAFDSHRPVAAKLLATLNNPKTPSKGIA